MNYIKAILKVRGQQLNDVFCFKKTKDIVITRQLIQYFLVEFGGCKPLRLEKAFKKFSQGFDHATIKHNIRVVKEQNYIYANEINKILKQLNYAS